MHLQSSSTKKPKLNRILAVLKVETDIITSIAVSLIGRAAILVIMYVETFKTNINVFSGSVTMCLTSQ
jgi:hypothetical protein